MKIATLHNHTCMQESDGIQQKLLDLKNRLAPTDQARRFDMINEYRELLKATAIIAIAPPTAILRTQPQKTAQAIPGNSVSMDFTLLLFKMLVHQRYALTSQLES